jgi:hypothetical protein
MLRMMSSQHRKALTRTEKRKHPNRIRTPTLQRLRQLKKKQTHQRNPLEIVRFPPLQQPGDWLASLT